MSAADSWASILDMATILASAVDTHTRETGRGVRWFLYRGTGPRVPARWLVALQALMARRRIASISLEDSAIADGGHLHLLAVDDEHAADFPRPEDFGCEAQRLEGLEIPVTLVRLPP